MNPSTIRKVKSADRTIDLLETLAGAQIPMTAAEISAALDIPKSSLFHLLRTLAERGYVAVNGEGRYRIGPSVIRLAAHLTSETSLIPTMEKVLEALCSTLNETCSFSVQKDDAVEVMATRSGRHALTYTMQLGDLAPLYAVSSGKILLAHKDKAWLDEYLARVRFERFTPNTIQSHERLLREIERARADGLGFVEEEFTPGIVGLSAAISHHDEIIGAINLAIPAARFTETMASQARHQLRIAASRAQSMLDRL